MATDIYRSIGIDTSDLNTGAATVGVSGSTATFSADLPLNIGVGDKLTYDGNTAYIHGRTSASVYTIKSATGGAPVEIGAGEACTIHRSYSSLGAFESGEDQDLVANDRKMFGACYADGDDTAYVAFGGWTTDATRLIRIFTPVSHHH